MRTLSLLMILLAVSFNGFSQFQPAPAFFRTPRALPLTELNTTQTIMVSSYGATVNDGNDDTAAIQNAINAAVSAGTIQNPVRLLFDTGTYDIKATTAARDSHLLTMTDAKGVLFDGNGAEFLIHNPILGLLSTLRCTNTIIKDFTVDHAILPFTQGKITNVDATNGFFEFVVDDGFPLPVEQHFVDSPQRWGMIKNERGGIKEGTPNLIGHNRFFELVGTRTYKYGNQSASTLSNVEVGDYFVHIARYNGSTIILNSGGKNLTYMNVIVYASASGGFNSRNSEEWHVLNCQLKLKEGRVHTTNADAMHINGSKIGPWVENCLFEGFSDDCMNLKYIKRDIREIHSSTQITVQGFTEVNDNLEFYNPRDGVFLGSATVTAVQNLGSNLYKLTLSSAVTITNIDATSDHQLTDKAYIENKSNESFIFRNNIVRNSRRYGILVQSKYALIENNLFQNLSGSGIRIENGVDWGEGFRADNIEIKNNRFENCGYDTDFIGDANSASIAVDFAKLGTPCTLGTTWCGTVTTDWQAHSNIRILDNTILYNKRGVYLKNINGLALTNNFICHRDADITLSGSETPIQQTILNSSNTNIVDYTFTLPQPEVQFILNEEASATTLENSGTNTEIDLDIITSGGIITQGYIDTEIGYAFQINTVNDGQLRLIDSNTSSVFPGPIGGAARTYAFWVKPAQSIFQTLLYSGGPTQGEVFSVQMEASGVLRVTDNNSNIVRMNDMPLTIGAWNHVAITVPENNSIFSVQLYKNGVASTETHSGNDNLINTASNRVDFFPRYNGIVSDIRYFDYQLCGSEIESIYNDRQKTLSNNILSHSKDEIIVYPTFVSNTLHFSKPVSAVKVVSILGRVLISRDEKNTMNELDVSTLPSGLYVVQINNSQTVKIYKN